jgi:hypothetical protein
VVMTRAGCDLSRDFPLRLLVKAYFAFTAVQAEISLFPLACQSPVLRQ